MSICENIKLCSQQQSPYHSCNTTLESEPAHLQSRICFCSYPSLHLCAELCCAVHNILCVDYICREMCTAVHCDTSPDCFLHCCSSSKHPHSLYSSFQRSIPSNSEECGSTFTENFSMQYPHTCKIIPNVFFVLKYFFSLRFSLALCEA